MVLVLDSSIGISFKSLSVIVNCIGLQVLDKSTYDESTIGELLDKSIRNL